MTELSTPVTAIPTAEREERLAEERLLLMAQTAIQRQLDSRGMRYRDLARLLEVSEARVSQMLGDDALNLTIRTIAKVFHRLGEKAVLTSERELGTVTDRVPAPKEVSWFLGVADQDLYEAPQATRLPRDARRRTGEHRGDWAAVFAADRRLVA